MANLVEHVTLTAQHQHTMLRLADMAVDDLQTSKVVGLLVSPVGCVVGRLRLVVWLSASSLGGLFPGAVASPPDR